MAQLGADAWILSLLASRARTSQSRGAGPALTARAAGCSSMSSTLPTLAVRAASFWRTSAASLLPPPPLWTKPKANSKNARPPASWENWPTAGGMRSGSLFQRPMWAPVMAEPGGSALHGEWLTLTGQASHWPSPNVQDAEAAGGQGAIGRGTRGETLHTMTAQWPTPASRDFRTPNSQESQESRTIHGGEQLPNFVEHHFSHPVLSTLDGRPLSPTARTLRRRLNPAFACWLMGWPIWWTNPALTSCAKSAMASWRHALALHLRSYCEGQA